MEVRGSVTDRPWGQTLGAIALRRHTGQLTIESDGKRYCIAFDDGAIVAASSPQAADAIARIALTNHFIIATQVSEISRRLAISPERDEVEVIADMVGFSPDQVLKLRHRVVAQRAARTFSLERGEFMLDDRIALPIAAGVAIDHRHVIYLGARVNVSEQRMLDDLRQLGSHFVVKPDAADELDRFGFEPSADPVLEALRRGTSLPELEAAHRELDPRFAQAIIYTLVTCAACVALPRTAALPPGAAASQAMPESSRTSTRPMKPAALRSRSDSNAPSPRRTRSGPVAIAPIAPAAPLGSAASAAEPFAPYPRAPTATEPRAHAISPRGTRDPLVEPLDGPAGTGADPPRRAAHSTPPPLAQGRVHTSPFASRSRTPSTGYAGTGSPDLGTNTPAATRSKAVSDPPSAAGRAQPRATTASEPPTEPAPPLTQPPASTPLARTQTPTPTARTQTPTPTARTQTPTPTARTQTPTPTARTQTPTPTARTQTPTPTARTQTPTPTARTQTPTPTGPHRPAPPPGPAIRIQTPPLGAPLPLPPPAEPDLGAPPSTTRVDTEETAKFVDTPTPPAALSAMRQRAVTFGEATRPGSSPGTGARPNLPRTPTPVEADLLRAFADQRTPGFADQRTPGFTDQRTPGFTDQRTPQDQRTPTDPHASFDPAQARTPTGGPMPSRVSTDNAAAAEGAFKRGELAMKRDQPGEAILEFKTACDLNPNEVDYLGMLAWAKFCAAGDKQGIGSETRKILERAVFKSARPERARFYLGRVERMLGRDKEALRHFQEVLDLKPNHAEAASEVRAIEARLSAAKGGTGLFGRKR
jgi:hypothetical protein